MASASLIHDPSRASLEARIMRRLQTLDTSVLRELDEWLETPESEPPADEEPRRGMTRRQMLGATVVGGAAVAGVGVTGTVLGLERGREAVTAPLDAANRTIGDLRASAAELGERYDAARDLITLYDELEAIDLDSTVSSGMSAVAAALGRSAQVAQSLREGLAVAQNNINQLDQGLAVIDGGLARAEGAISLLSALMQQLEDRLRSAGEPIRPVTEALGGFFTGLISRIPRVGDDILQTIERVQAVIGAIPESIENVNRDLIEPLRTRFFPREGDSINVRLIDPLAALIFEPADRLLAGLAGLADTWQGALERPATAQIEARAGLKKRIADLRVEKDI